LLEKSYDKVKKKLNYSNINSEITPENYAKELHNLRLENAELRKELADRRREKGEAEKNWVNKSNYAEQLRKLMNSKSQCITKQEEELKKQIKIRNDLKLLFCSIFFQKNKK